MVGGLIPTQLAPSSWNINLAPPDRLVEPCNVGGSPWIQPFLFGFPPVVRISQKGCFPVKDKELKKNDGNIPKSLRSPETCWMIGMGNQVAKNPELSGANLRIRSAKDGYVRRSTKAGNVRPSPYLQRASRSLSLAQCPTYLFGLELQRAKRCAHVATYVNPGRTCHASRKRR